MAYNPLRHLGLKLLSLVLAVLLWSTVAKEPIVERTLRVPLQFQNIPEDLEVVGEPPSAVDVRVRGASNLVGQLQPGEVVAVLDLTTARPGFRLFHIVAAEIEAPFGVEVSQVTPATVPLEFERLGTRDVPVAPAVEGDPAPGYQLGRVTASPATVKVVGPESRLRDVSEATTEPVAVAGAQENVREQVTVGVLDSAVRLATPVDATVVVEVVPAPIERVFRDLRIDARNLRDGLRAQMAPAGVTVTLRGGRDVMSRLSQDDVEVSVDLASLGPGRYNLPVRTILPPAVGVMRVDPSTVDVAITR